MKFPNLLVLILTGPYCVRGFKIFTKDIYCEYFRPSDRFKHSYWTYLLDFLNLLDLFEYVDSQGACFSCFCIPSLSFIKDLVARLKKEDQAAGIVSTWLVGSVENYLLIVENRFVAVLL